MAHKTSDGKREFTNKSMAKQYDRRQAGMAEEKEAPAQESPEQQGAEEAPEDVAMHHGPATQVTHTHDHEGGMHHVHSMHPDGYEHHSDHGSMDEAMEHHKKLAEHDEQNLDQLKGNFDKFMDEEAHEGAY